LCRVYTREINPKTLFHLILQKVFIISIFSWFWILWWLPFVHMEMNKSIQKWKHLTPASRAVILLEVGLFQLDVNSPLEVYPSLPSTPSPYWFEEDDSCFRVGLEERVKYHSLTLCVVSYSRLWKWMLA